MSVPASENNPFEKKLSNEAAQFNSGFEELMEGSRDIGYIDPTVRDLTSEIEAKDVDSAKQYDLHCFHCNRQEYHVCAIANNWQYCFLIGLTFGLIRFVGPYYCKCCGHPRLMWTDRLNFRVWLRNWRIKKGHRAVRSKRRSR